jgi:hypothetical protein
LWWHSCVASYMQTACRSRPASFGWWLHPLIRFGAADECDVKLDRKLKESQNSQSRNDAPAPGSARSPSVHPTGQSSGSLFCSDPTVDEIDVAAMTQESDEDNVGGFALDDQPALDLTNPPFPLHGMKFLAARAQFGLSDPPPPPSNLTLLRRE